MTFRHLLTVLSITLTVLLLLGPALLGCSDTGLRTLADQLPPDRAEPADDQQEDPTPPEVVEEEVPEDEGEPTSEVPPDDPEEPELPPCSETIEADWQWWGSMPFGYEAHPTDGQGRPFYAVDFQMIDFSTVQLPDQGHTPPGYDRVYRATFWLDSLPPALFLSMQSDDGMWFFMNGQEVGHWGGDFQEEGCVNDNANCTETTTVPPQDITDYLVVGENVAAARVSNAVMNTFFEVFTECVD